MNGITIIRVKPKELDQLQEIGKLTFLETFSAGNTEENMRIYLEKGFSIEKLTSELYDQNSEFYFAVNGQKAIAYLKLNYGAAQTELKDPHAVEIERIYVLKAYQGKGIGPLLFDKAIKIAKTKNSDYIWLGVWEENLRAINFYKKIGFIQFDKHPFKFGDEEQTDIMMKLEI